MLNDKFSGFMTSSSLIPPGSVIGIMGGGQLGRMLAMAAAHMGYRVHVFTPDEDSPASQVAWKTTVADYGDEAALKAFAGAVDVITFEFENIPPSSLELLASVTTVHPSPEVLKTCRHRLREKEMIRKQGIGTAPFAAVNSAEELAEAIREIGFPAVIKTCEMGYDGKGQVKLDANDDLESAWQSLGATEAIVEGWVRFDREISVIVARNARGEVVCYEPSHNIHASHILSRTLVPADIDPAVREEAQAIARKLAKALDLVGIVAVEMFLQSDGHILVNELAPRPHNSGHWTMEAAATSQFEQQIRAICGYSPGETTTLCPAEMLNLIGDEVGDWKKYAAMSDAHVHLYGKSEARPGRKMGHVTIVKSLSGHPAT